MSNEVYEYQENQQLSMPAGDDRPVGAPSSKAPIFTEYPDEVEGSILLPCIICSRTFFPRALERHQKVCQKLQFKKRGVFELTKKRQQGFDIPLLGLHPPKEAGTPKSKTKWREKRKEFLRLIRAAKNDKDDGDCEKFIPSDYSQCPYCQRYFGPRAIDRHAAWCQEQKSRLPRSLTTEDNEAIHRLKTRTKYTPPKPGHSEWKAPKKGDVVSSIPPASSSPNHVPVNRIMSPNPFNYRRPSPTLPLRGQCDTRYFNPLASNSPTRKGSSAAATLPGGPQRSYTGSLGRSSGRKFSDMLQTLTGCNSGYGVSSGYGSSSLYGSPTAPTPPSSFNRSNSLRLQKHRSDGRMARHRDLASDMLASVTLGEKTKREEPDGDEGSNSVPYEELYSERIRPHYDPFSAAELQFQDLLHPSDHFQSDKMGSTSSLKDIDIKRPYMNLSEKPRSRSRAPGGSLSLCSLGIDSFDLNTLDLNSPDEESSEFESSDHSPIEPRSIVAETEEIIASLNRPTRAPKSNYIGGISSSYYDKNNFINSPSRYYTSSFNKDLKMDEFDSVGRRKMPDGANSWGKGPMHSHQSEDKWDSFSYLSPKKQSSERNSRMKSPRHTRGSSLPRLHSALFTPESRTTKIPLSPKSSVPSFCYECGQKYSFYGAKFCSNCGVKRICGNI